MKRISGVMLLLISIAVTTIGSLLKVINQIAVSEVFLWIGMIAFIVAIGMIIYRFAKPFHSEHGPM